MPPKGPKPPASPPPPAAGPWLLLNVEIESASLRWVSPRSHRCHAGRRMPVDAGARTVVLRGHIDH